MAAGDHLTFVRAQGCVVRTKAADRCYGPTEAHHVRTAANSGMGMKPPDSAAVGLCMRHHRALHSNGRRTFETLHGIDLAAEADRLTRQRLPPRDPPQPLTPGTPTMSDATVLQHDQTLDVLRQREIELDIEGRVIAGRLAELRELIALCSRRPRTARKPRALDTPQSDFAALGAGTASDTARTLADAA